MSSLVGGTNGQPGNCTILFGYDDGLEVPPGEKGNVSRPDQLMSDDSLPGGEEPWEKQ